MRINNHTEPLYYFHRFISWPKEREVAKRATAACEDDEDDEDEEALRELGKRSEPF